MRSVGLGTPHNYEDLSNKDLRKNAYTKAELRQTNFSNSDLSGVSLFGALAKGANFSGATLRATDLESADLEDADFTNAILEGALVSVHVATAITTGQQLTQSWLNIIVSGTGYKSRIQECQDQRQRLDRCSPQKRCSKSSLCHSFWHKPKDRS